MPIRSNRYSDPALGAAFENIASLFAPPSAQDAAAYASAGDSSAAAALKKQKLDQISQLFGNPTDPQFDRRGIAAGLYAPNQSFEAVNIGDATARRGQDITANTSITNNKADNQAKFITGAFGPVSQDALRPEVPASIASMFGVDQPLPEVQGNRSSLSETQVKGALLQQQLPQNPPQLTNDQTVALSMGATPVENIVDAQGQPRTVYRADAVGHQPAYAPNATIMSDGLPKPPDGYVWQQGPDGKPALDERGAPIAIAYQNGPAWQQQQNREQVGQANDIIHNLVIDKATQALDQIAANPNLVTGLGAQLTSAIGGGPANDLAQTLAPIKANIMVDRLQAMRMASPTGGALGNVTESEGRKLESLYGSMEQSQSAPQLMQNIKTFMQAYYDTINGPGEWGKRQAAEAAAISAGPPLPPGVTEEDVQHTMQIHGLTRDQVLARLGGT